MTSLGEQFPKAQKRVREMQQRGRDLGPAGQFYVMVCEEALLEAEVAAISGDLPRMIRAYQAMEEIN